MCFTIIDFANHRFLNCRLKLIAEYQATLKQKTKNIYIYTYGEGPIVRILLVKSIWYFHSENPILTGPETVTHARARDGNTCSGKGRSCTPGQPEHAMGPSPRKALTHHSWVGNVFDISVVKLKVGPGHNQQHMLGPQPVRHARARRNHMLKQW